MYTMTLIFEQQHMSHCDRITSFVYLFLMLEHLLLSSDLFQLYSVLRRSANGAYKLFHTLTTTDRGSIYEKKSIVSFEGLNITLYEGVGATICRFEAILHVNVICYYISRINLKQNQLFS